MGVSAFYWMEALLPDLGIWVPWLCAHCQFLSWAALFFQQCHDSPVPWATSAPVLSWSAQKLSEFNSAAPFSVRVWSSLETGDMAVMETDQAHIPGGKTQFIQENFGLGDCLMRQPCWQQESDMYSCVDGTG